MKITQKCTIAFQKAIITCLKALSSMIRELERGVNDKCDVQGQKIPRSEFSAGNRGS